MPSALDSWLLPKRFSRSPRSSGMTSCCATWTERIGMSHIFSLPSKLGSSVLCARPKWEAQSDMQPGTIFASGSCSYPCISRSSQAKGTTTACPKQFEAVLARRVFRAKALFMPEPKRFSLQITFNSVGRPGKWFILIHGSTCWCICGAARQTMMRQH